MRLDEDERPEVLGAGNVVAALVVHVVLFLVLWIAARVQFKPKEIAVPIDLLVVVNENLDGKENEPPPVQEPPKETPKPPPKPQPQVKETPKEPEKVEAVEVVKEKPKVDPIKRIQESLKDRPKEPPKEKPKEPKKSREELIREKMKGQPTKAAVKIKVNAPSGDGKTAKKTLSDAEIRKLLGEGYKPGATTQLAASEEQRCISLIKQAFYSKWTTRPAWNDTLKDMRLRISFGPGGRVVGYKLVQSSGDRAADSTVLLAAELVKVVHGLSEAFVNKHKNDIIIQFEVTPQ